MYLFIFVVVLMMVLYNAKLYLFFFAFLGAAVLPNLVKLILTAFCTGDSSSVHLEKNEALNCEQATDFDPLRV